MIKILDDSKTLTQLNSDTTNGLGSLECLSCLVTEELNGIFEAELTFLQTTNHASDIHVGSILKLSVNDTDYHQMFRVYYVSKPMNEVITAKASHISYDLSKIPVEPFSATGCSLSCSGLVSHSVVSNPFSMSTDITNTTSVFTLTQPRSFRECLGGYEGSMLDTFRGEYKWDNLTVNYLARRGADNGVRISYGKNLTDFQQETNNAEVYTGVLGFATVDDTCYVGNVYNKTTGNKIKIVDFSSDYESGQTPTTAELTTKAQTYATNNDIEVPNVNIKISFVPLYQTEEYKNIAPLERVSLGDTVHVYFEKLGVEASSRVVKTVWNVLLNKYDSVELGSTKANLNTVINDSIESATSDILSNLDIDTGAIEDELSEMSQLIINGLGLHCTKVPLQSGGYRFYLHNADTLANSQYQYVITAQGFMVSDDYGQTWNSGWDNQGNVVVNSLATITLKFLEGYGMYMRFGDANSNYIEVAPYSVNNTPQGVSFDGSGYVRFQPQGAFLVNNLNSTQDHSYNTLSMRKWADSNNVDHSTYQMFNYNPSTYNAANSILMSASVNSNNIALSNYDPTNSTIANQITMNRASNTNRFELTNYFMGSSQASAQIWMDAPSNTGGRINLYSYNSSGSTVNTIVMSESSMSITGRELSITSTGALRLSSQSSQDIHINAADDLYIAANDKIYWRGVQVGFISVGGESVLGAL